MSHLHDAFHAVIADAILPEAWYVSLCENVPFYGGAEEGGWWGTDTHVHAFKDYPTEELANAAKAAVEKLAQELNDEAKRAYGQQCLNEMAFLDARGLDADWLREPDGPSEYFVSVTNEVPTGSRGDRCYS